MAEAGKARYYETLDVTPVEYAGNVVLRVIRAAIDATALRDIDACRLWAAVTAELEREHATTKARLLSAATAPRHHI